MRLIDIEDEALLAELREKQDACKELIANATDDDPTWTEREHWEGVYGSFVEMALTIKAAPTVEAEPVKHGRWVRLDMHKGMADHKCTACNSEVYVPTSWGEPLYGYCPVCGARMDLEEVADAETNLR